MPHLSLGDLTICEIALINLMKGVDENSDLGQQILECIAKVDAWVAGIRVEFDNKQTGKS